MGPAYLVLFHRLAAPSVEVCAAPGDPLAVMTIDAVLFTEQAYGARWADIGVSDCTAPPAAGTVRVQRANDCSEDPARKVLAHTLTVPDADGYVTGPSVVSICAEPTVKLLAHELTHAQGIGEVCDHDFGDAVPRCGTDLPRHVDPFADALSPQSDPLHLDLRGHLMHPDYQLSGLDVTGLRWAIRQVYADAPTGRPHGHD